MTGIMISVAHGFGKMITESGQSDVIIQWLAGHAEDGRAMASFEMILIGALIAIGIGSSFSTVPIVASVYVPLGIKLGFYSQSDPNKTTGVIDARCWLFLL